MSTLQEITFGILDTVRPDNMTNTSITEELVKFHIKNIRAQLAKQHLGKYGFLHPQWFQSLGCVPVIQADPSECCNYPTGCTILRTENIIPNTIEGVTNLLTRVGPVDITSKPYQHIEFERVPFEGLNKYTKSLIKWFQGSNANYVYLLVNMNDYLVSGLEVVHMHGVFEDPEALSEFTNCSTGEACFSDKSDYPIPDSLIPILQEMVIKKFILPQSQAPIDVTNDAKTNPDTTIGKGV